MKLVTSQQMRDADYTAINVHGIPSLTLMEKAGMALADFTSQKFRPERGAISILVGKGNNGGDGLVAARLLIEKGYEVLVFLTCQLVELSPDARANWERLALLTPTFFQIGSESELRPHYLTFARSACIIDALLGTGLSSEVKSPYKEIIDFINTLKIPVIAADIPSGLSSDTGMPLGTAIFARWTVTFGLPKIGLFTGHSSEYTRFVQIADIGIPKEVVDKIETKYHLIEPDLFKDHFKERPPESHKGLFGHVVVIAGSGGKLGAGWLASMGALRAGCGLVTYALPDHSFSKFDARYPEVMAVSLPDKGRGHLHPDGLPAALELIKDKTAAAIGPAVGTHEETKGFVTEFIRRAGIPLVIDADALNVIADNPAVLDYRTAPTIVTPHPGEMARLAKTDAVKKEEERLPSALKFAASHRVHVVFKGYRTIVATPGGDAYINPTGNPSMATAGMGDALTGMITGFIAQGMGPSTAAMAAVYCHGLAGDIAEKQFGSRGVVASDVIRCFPEAMRSVVEKN
jgi:NAD(P)H-hydrate epimerase